MPITEPLPGTDEKLYQRFMKYVNKTDKCWIWTGGKNNKLSSYGRFKVCRKHTLAHKFSYTLFIGEIPIGKQIRHTCDTPSCVNPNHLEIGSHQDNMDDKVARNRQAKGDSSGSRKHPESRPKGEKHWLSKFTSFDIIQIRKDHTEGVTNAALAKKWNVARYTIYCIVNNITWRHITSV